MRKGCVNVVNFVRYISHLIDRGIYLHVSGDIPQLGSTRQGNEGGLQRPVYKVTS